MKASSVFRRSVWPALAVFSAMCLVAPIADAQTAKPKPPPRVSPNPADATRIPAGVDTGSPITSDSMQLGMPVPPSGSLERSNMKGSAAARAAARPNPQTSNGAPLRAPETIVVEPARAQAARPGTRSPADDCAATATRAYNAAMSTCTALAERGARADCATRAAEARRTSCSG